MNFITDSLPSIAYCGHILININYNSMVGQNSSVGRRRLTFTKERLGARPVPSFVSSNLPHNPVRQVLLSPTVNVMAVTGAQRCDIFCQGARGAWTGEQLCVTPQSTSTVPPPPTASPISNLCSFGKNPSESGFSLEMPPSAISFPHSLNGAGSNHIDLGLGFPKWLVRIEHVIQEDLMRGIANTLEKLQRLQSHVFSISFPKVPVWKCPILPAHDLVHYFINLSSLLTTPMSYFPRFPYGHHKGFSTTLLSEVSVASPSTSVTFFLWPNPHVSNVVFQF